MRIALASPHVATSLPHGLATLDRFQSEAAAAGAQIVCFPEAWLPGLRGQDFEPFPFEMAEQARILDAAAAGARSHRIATILSTELITPSGRQIAAWVFSPDGSLQGFQSKNQLAPSEDAFYIPGHTRQLFEVGALRFGVAICHEGWRYPETVRWAAQRGAHLVFHPHHTGSDQHGTIKTTWGDPDGPYYEAAMRLRSIENTIYFASVNYALRFQESATSVVSPDGVCQAHLPYGTEGLLVQEIQPELATGLIARRFAPERYQNSATNV